MSCPRPRAQLRREGALLRPAEQQVGASKSSSDMRGGPLTRSQTRRQSARVPVTLEYFLPRTQVLTSPPARAPVRPVRRSSHVTASRSYLSVWSGSEDESSPEAGAAAVAPLPAAAAADTSSSVSSSSESAGSDASPVGNDVANAMVEETGQAAEASLQAAARVASGGGGASSRGAAALAHQGPGLPSLDAELVRL